MPHPEADPSVVVFPFRSEDHQVVINNITFAATHPRVGRVLCVGFEEESTYRAIEKARPAVEAASDTPVTLMLQDRIGSLRPGKGDGMNTALRYFLEETDAGRLHFYDADIRSFTQQWIDKAEAAADAGHEVVRHYFPRSSTDAMITWMITRTGFALLWPESELSRVEQPLGGELLLTRPVVEDLAANAAVMAQSDWGIDTLYTFATTRRGYRVYETYIAAGKIHKLYGGLTDLRTMLTECFAAVQSLRPIEVPPSTPHVIEAATEVTAEIEQKVGYDVEATIGLLADGWTPRQEELLDAFPRVVCDGMRANRVTPRFGFMDDDTWREVYLVLLDHFERDDPDWESLLFRLWIARVLRYTVSQALRGYDHAMDHLQRMIETYRSGG